MPPPVLRLINRCWLAVAGQRACRACSHARRWPAVSRSSGRTRPCGERQRCRRRPGWRRPVSERRCRWAAAHAASSTTRRSAGSCRRPSSPARWLSSRGSTGGGWTRRPVSGAAGLVNSTRRAFRVPNSDRIADSASSLVAPVSGTSWPVTSSVVTCRSDSYRAAQLARGGCRMRRYPWMVLVCRALPARGPRPCRASAQVLTSAANGAGKAASRAASHRSKAACGLGRADPGRWRNRRSAIRFVRWSPPEPGGVPRRLAEVFPAGQHGGHGAPGLPQRVRRPAAGLPIARERVQRRRHGGDGTGPGRFTGSLTDGPGGALAGPARPGRADRLLPPAPGTGPHRVDPAESPAGPAQPAGQPSWIRSARQAPVTSRVPGSRRGLTRGRRAQAASPGPGRPGPRAGRTGTPRPFRSAAGPRTRGRSRPGALANNRHAAVQYSSLVRSPQSRQAPVTSRDLASQLRQRPDHSRATCFPQPAHAPARAAARFLQRSHRSPSQTGRCSPQPGQMTRRVRDNR